jgi:hypothetical protein
MTEVMAYIVRSYVKLKNRVALEEMRDRHRGLMKETGSRTGRDIDLDTLHATLEKELAVMERGLHELTDGEK